MLNSKIINPSSIVVVGGSDDTTKPGGKVLKNILDGNFKGELYAINPKADIVQGIQSFRDPKDLPQVDLAIIGVAAQHIKGYVQTLVQEKGVKALIILSAGFSEMGEDGEQLEQEIVKIADNAGACLIGPNCIGVLTPYYNGIFAGPIPKLNPQGCDFVSGSGATAVFIVEKGIPMGLSFASLWSVGNSAQIGVEDVVEYWDKSFDAVASSKVKLIYMENVAQPEKLLKHAQSLIKKGCRIAAVKSGSSAAGSRAASSHTGALASPDDAVDALFRKAGIVRCYGREDLILTASLFLYPELKGKSIAVITHAGGPGVMLTDALSKGGLDVPHISGAIADELLSKLYPGSSVANPIDFLATGSAEQLGIIIDYIEEKFDSIDGMAVIFGDPGLFDVKPVYKVLSEKIQSCTKPIFPVLPSVYSATEAIEYFKDFGNVYFADEVNLGEKIAKAFHTPKPMLNQDNFNIDTDSIRKVIAKEKSGYIQPSSIQTLLDAAGIPRAKEAVTADKSEVSTIIDDLGFPLVMKVIGPVHKSDVGGVLLNIDSASAAKEAFDKLMGIKEATGVLFQPMLSGRELFVGAKKEDPFGHLVLCGLGGIFIEVLEDTASGLVPINQREAEYMINLLKGKKILDGVRGQSGVDKNRFAEIIARLSALLEAAPEIIELDLNPLLGTDTHVTAVDARIRIEK